MLLVERVSRVLCFLATGELVCSHCENTGDCTMWQTFENEAKGAISEIRKADRNKKFQDPRT